MVETSATASLPPTGRGATVASMASGLRNDKKFMSWALADGISVTGTAISNVVLPLVFYEETVSAAATGELFALRVIPYILFGAVAGPVADRWNRRRLIL